MPWTKKKIEGRTYKLVNWHPYRTKQDAHKAAREIRKDKAKVKSVRTYKDVEGYWLYFR